MQRPLVTTDHRLPLATGQCDGVRRAFLACGTTMAMGMARPAGAQARPEQARVVIAVGGRAELCHLPLAVAAQRGYFQEEGLEVEIQDVGSETRAQQAVVSGSSDVCSGAFEHTIQARMRNQWLRAFVLQARAPQIALGVSTRAVPDYANLSDLRGRRIGIVANGSATHLVASQVLLRGGVRSTEVSFVGLDTGAAALLSLRSGQIDALSNTDPVMTQLEQRGDVKIVGDTRTLKGTQTLFGGLMPSTCLYAQSSYLQKNPRTAQALASAMVHALKWLQTAGPGDILRTVPEAYLLGDRALYLASFEKVREAISPDGLMSDDAARTALRAQASFDSTVRADRIDLSMLFTNEFARRAKDRFKA